MKGAAPARQERKVNASLLPSAWLAGLDFVYIVSILHNNLPEESLEIPVLTNIGADPAEPCRLRKQACFLRLSASFSHLKDCLLLRSQGNSTFHS